MLSPPFHIPAILKHAAVLSQKSEEMCLLRTFCSSTAKKSTVTPIFYLMILTRTVLPFNEKKNGINLCSVFFVSFTKLYNNNVFHSRLIKLTIFCALQLAILLI